jgi:hypothetical protein
LKIVKAKLERNHDYIDPSKPGPNWKDDFETIIQQKNPFIPDLTINQMYAMIDQDAQSKKSIDFETENFTLDHSRPPRLYLKDSYFSLSGVRHYIEKKKKSIASFSSTLTFEKEVEKVLDTIVEVLASTQSGITIRDASVIHVYVQNMSDFAKLNSVYGKYFGNNPPARYKIIECPSSV